MSGGESFIVKLSEVRKAVGIKGGKESTKVLSAIIKEANGDVAEAIKLANKRKSSGELDKALEKAKVESEKKAAEKKAAKAKAKENSKTE
jgi:hypothetical protein